MGEWMYGSTFSCFLGYSVENQSHYSIFMWVFYVPSHFAHVNTSMQGQNIILSIFIIYTFCSFYNKRICIQVREWVSPSGVTHMLVCSLRCHFNACVEVLELGQYLFSLCVVSLLSSRLTVSPLVWFSIVFKYLPLNTVFRTEYGTNIFFQLIMPSHVAQRCMCDLYRKKRRRQITPELHSCDSVSDRTYIDTVYVLFGCVREVLKRYCISVSLLTSWRML
jgi:hypothetical protein